LPTRRSECLGRACAEVAACAKNQNIPCHLDYSRDRPISSIPFIRVNLIAEIRGFDIHYCMSNLDWTLARSFLAVAESGSLSAAARRLGLS
jgi:hypothetical protein